MLIMMKVFLLISIVVVRGFFCVCFIKFLLVKDCLVNEFRFDECFKEDVMWSY